MEPRSTYSVSSSFDDGILEITEAGEVKEKEVETLTNEVLSIIKASNVESVLVDVRTIKGRFGYTEAYMRVKNFPAERATVNIAIVYHPENAEYEKYQETIALNAGLSWKCFEDIDAARSWLKSRRTESNRSAEDNIDVDAAGAKDRNAGREERRQTERLEDVNEVIISVISGEEDLSAEKVIYSHSKDISVSGARLRATIVLPVGTILKIDFTLKDLQQKITALGKVKWIKVIIEDQYYESGVEFVNTPGEAIQKIKNYISWKKIHQS